MSEDIKLTPFDFAKAAGHTKTDIFTEESSKQYSAYMVNRIFSQFNDTILHASEMNLHQVPPYANFLYYMGALRSRARFAKWAKPENEALINMLQEYYDCSRHTAEQYSVLMTPELIVSIEKKLSKGGSSGKDK
jgi:hypothetical protein